MDVYELAAEKIIHKQEDIIGPLALEQAKQVEGLALDGDHVSFTGNKVDILEQLVEQYRQLFGQTSVEVCKEAASAVLSQLHGEAVPQLLR
jgi:hypothetical protein